MQHRMFNHKKPIILTPIEEKIVILLCNDLPLTEIAERLGIRYNTVSETVCQARKKNKIKTNCGLVARYIGNGYYSEIWDFKVKR